MNASFVNAGELRSPVKPEKPMAYMNWSGGKDSALCLYRTLQSGSIPVTALLTSMNSFHHRISMHGVRRALLEAQARAIHIPLHTIELPEQPDMQVYETAMMNKLTAFRESGYNTAIFGDIFLEDLRKYREQTLHTMGIACRFPLWKLDTGSLVKEFISLGFKSIVVCVQEEVLDRHFCGRIIDDQFLADLPDHVDPCGENGEFHTFVFAGPLFNQPVPFKKGEIVYKRYHAPENQDAGDDRKVKASSYGFYFCDLIPV
ncbi:MAG TPA: hypothetical protein VMI35_12210 [Puia sp.]|nr:hypothetical protein [Puia sp.]